MCSQSWTLPGLLGAEMMKALPISSLRLTLWYRDVDGSFELDKTAENAIKGCGFRWFQLTNLADGRRGLRG